MGKFKEFFRFPNLPGKRFQVIVATVALLAVGVGVYFTIHITNQTDYWNDRNFRQLNNLSSQISTRVNSLTDGFSSSVLATLTGQVTFENSLKTIDGVEFKEPRITRAKFSQAGCEMRLLPGNNSPLLQIICRVPAPTPGEKEAAEKTGAEFSAKTKFADLIAPFLSSAVNFAHRTSEHEEGFDEVLIASLESDSNRNINAGDVIFNRGSSELAATSLNNLTYSGNRDKKLDFAAFGQTTNSVDVELGGADYRLYGQPLELNTGPAGSRWVICGLVQSSHLRHQTWAVSYTMIVVLAFLAALVPLSWPFLKILFIGPKDRLRLADVYFGWFALVVGCALLTFFILWAFSYSRYDSQLDQQMKVLARDISTHWKNEISKVDREIELSNKRKNDSGPIFETNISEDQAKPIGSHAVLESPADPELPLEMVKARPREEAQQETRILQHILLGHECVQQWSQCLRAEPFPYFGVVYWIDEKGDQKIKWLANATKTNPHSVKDRAYFTEMINDRGLKVGGRQMWISPQSSSVTAAKTVVISQPLRPDPNSENSTTESLTSAPNGVIALAGQLLSVMDALTPAGFSYRIVDKEGEVLFQSAESKLWRENFFEECGNDRLLRSVVDARVEQPLEVNYKGRTHSILVTPLDSSPGWSLVVIRDKQLLRTVYLEILTLAATLFFFYMVLLLVVFMIFYLVRTTSDRRNEWIWPAPDALPTYYRSIVVSLIFCALAVLAILFTKGGWTVFWVSAIAFVGIAGFLLRLRHKWVSRTINLVAQEMKINRSLNYARAYIGNLVLLVILVGILPALAFYKVAYDGEMLLFIKHIQIKLAEGLRERESRIAADYEVRRPDNAGPFDLSAIQVANSFVDRRKRETDDTYASFFYNTGFHYGTATRTEQSECNAKGAALGPLMTFFASLVPFYNQTSVELLEFTSDCSADSSWRWSSAEKDLRLQAPKDPRAGESVLFVETPLSQYQRPTLWTRAIVLLVASFALLLAALSLLARFIVRKVYLLDFEERSFKLLPANGLANAQENLFVVLNQPGLSPDSIQGNGNLHWVDLKNNIPVLSEIEATAAQAVVFDNFAEGMKDLHANEVLDLLEHLIPRKRKLVLLSTEEPSSYGWTQVQVDEQDIEGRWAEIAGCFTKVYYTESCCTDNFEHNLVQLQSEVQEDAGLSKSQKKRVMRSIAILRQECSPRLVLRRLGNQLLKGLQPETMKPAEVFRQISERAHLYYQRVWEDCSEDEKLTILHLAEDRLLSPNDPHIRQLFLRGTIVRSPDVRLFNDSFRDFVLNYCFTGTLVSIETQAKQKSPWERLKLPLLVALAGVLLFLMITQREFFGSSLSLITGLTTGIPTVFKLISFLQSQGGGQKVLNSAANQLTT